MYRSYEDYMQTVLGYSYGPDTYREVETYNTMQLNPNMQELNKLYPEIYRVVYPVVQKACSRRNMSNVTDKMLSEIVDEVYSVIEPGDDIVEQRELPLKNGDVKNPRAKDTRQRRNNPLLMDLIRILVLRELLPGGMPGYLPVRPGFPGGGPGGRPPMPPPLGPGIGPRPPMPPVFRPGNTREY